MWNEESIELCQSIEGFNEVQSRSKYTIKVKYQAIWTKTENFDTCFIKIFNRYRKIFIFGAETGE